MFNKKFYNISAEEKEEEKIGNKNVMILKFEIEDTEYLFSFTNY